TLSCTLAPGLYHPWAGTKAEFATLTRVERWRVVQGLTVEPEPGRRLSLAVGDIVEIPTYLSEGYCQWRVRGQTFAEWCPGNDPDPRFAALPPTPADYTDQQVLGVACREGHAAWIDVTDALLATPGVREGDIVEYGAVGPAGTGGGF
ncbi:MAG: hypothetical protein ACK4YP_19595, partial [Myxococcota bacterium]